MILSSNSIEFALLTDGRHAGARAARAGVAGLFGDEPGPRQAALRLRPDQARHGVRAERRDLCATRWRRWTSRACCWSMSTRRRRRCSRCRGASWSRRRPTDAVARVDRADRAQDRRQVPVHLGQHRHAQGGDQHPGDDVRQPGDGPDGAHAQARRSAAGACSTGCRGTTRWAATPPSRAISPRAARPRSTTASRCPACSRRRCAICARSRRPPSPTCRRATPCWRRRWRRTRRWRSSSSRT